jgi:hypothetical protein
MKVSIPGFGLGPTPYPEQRERAGILPRVHDQPFLPVEQAMHAARERQRITDTARAEEEKIAARNREPYKVK